MYNNCPLCNNELIKKSTAFISFECTTYTQHYRVLCSRKDLTIFEEMFIINEYSIYRSDNETEIYKNNNKILCLDVDFVLPFNKFNTIQKIEKLLFIS